MRCNGVAIEFSAMTSATADPRPPVVKWFSMVITPAVAERSAVTMVGSVKGFRVDT